ncbi:MAG: response regulator [Candidatus Cloacimonetes bacterium]|nr:response regulator [Candidatus Cloacimonadota bacterium]
MTNSFELYDVIPEGIFVVNSDYKIVFWNQRMEFWSKLSKNQVQNQELFEIYPHLKKDRYKKRIDNLLNGAPTVLFSSQLNPHFIPLQYSKDKLKIVYTTVSLFQFQQDSYFIFCIQDFTNHRNNILEIEELRKQAQKANEYKGEFLATVSHELRTPLNGILGLTDLTLQSEDLSEENQENLSLVKYSGEKLLNLISGILDLSKIEAQQLILESAAFSFPNDILRNIQSLSLKAHEKHLDIFLDFDRDIPSNLVGDITRLNQVITNLVGNATKFTHQGSITIKASKQVSCPNSCTVLFEIIDTGIGIAKSKLGSIFNSYTQASESTTREYGGTGLGTTISKEIVELMGGEIWIESELEKGSNFKFLIEFAIDPTKEVHTLNPNDFSEKKVLFYSPSLDFISNIQNKLTPYNFKFKSFSNSSQFLLQEQDLFDFVFIDQLDFTLDHSLKDKTVFFKNITDKISIDTKENLVLTKPVSHLKLFQSLIEPSTIDILNHKQTEPDTNQNNKSLRVLIVDDNHVNQKLAQKLLDKLNHSVEIASGGYESIDKCKESNFDLILMDISMPDLNGYQATKIIRSFDTTTPIVAMTANSFKEDKDKCLNFGMNGYIEKPINFVSVQRTLNAISNKKEIHISYEQSESSEIYPLKKLLTLFDDEKDYTIEMINSFLSSTKVRLERLHHAIVNQNLKQVQFEVHSLKGISLVFNAIKFTQILKVLQSTPLQDQNKVLHLFESASKENENITNILTQYKSEL